MDDTAGNHQIKCSFCAKRPEEVRRLIAGRDGYICDECVELCRLIVDQEVGAQH